jgi:GntR family transcriptional regulator
MDCIDTLNTVGGTALEFQISATTGVPIYQQLTEQICSGIARGKLRPDERLPSVRELSQSLVVNPNTVARAYGELEHEGVLYTRPGMGVFVAKAPPPLAKKTRRQRLLAGVDRLLVQASRIGFSAEELLEFIEERMKQYNWNSTTEPAHEL